MRTLAGRALPLAALLALVVGVVGAGENLLGESATQRFAQRYGDQAAQRLAGWKELMRIHRDSPELEKLRKVNAYFNDLPWVSDEKHWGKRDYWATPLEMMGTYGGDCEDYSVAKFITLVHMGVDPMRMRITYVRAPKLRQPHMVVAYYSKPGAQPLILDALATRFNTDERLAVNLSASAVQDADFVRWLSGRLAGEPRARCERLLLEVTEHVVIQHRESFRSLLDAMQPLGVDLGVDHCGAGDVSLAGLRGLRVTYAKLYGALVHGVLEDRQRQSMLRSLVSVGHGMGLVVIAEFVEADAEYEAVRDIGFDGAQGYHVGRPQALD